MKRFPVIPTTTMRISTMAAARTASRAMWKPDDCADDVRLTVACMLGDVIMTECERGWLLQWYRKNNRSIIFFLLFLNFLDLIKR